MAPIVQQEARFVHRRLVLSEIVPVLDARGERMAVEPSHDGGLGRHPGAPCVVSEQARVVGVRPVVIVLIIGGAQQERGARPEVTGDLQVYEAAGVAGPCGRIVEDGVECARGDDLAARPESGLQLERAG
jgi:hypothetical protein